jgi:hypothetical protein
MTTPFNQTLNPLLLIVLITLCCCCCCLLDGEAEIVEIPRCLLPPLRHTLPLSASITCRTAYTWVRLYRNMKPGVVHHMLCHSRYPFLCGCKDVIYPLSAAFEFAMRTNVHSKASADSALWVPLSPTTVLICCTLLLLARSNAASDHAESRRPATAHIRRLSSCLAHMSHQSSWKISLRIRSRGEQSSW